MNKENGAPEVKKLKVELTHQEWNIVLRVINQSNAPHLMVEEVKAGIAKQINPQIAAINEEIKKQNQKPEDITPDPHTENQELKQ